jgi:hypothetical protein
MAEPTITFGTTTKFGSLTGWAPNGATLSKTKDRAAALDGIGNEVASTTFNERTEYSQEFVSSATSAPTIPDTLGELVGSCVLTGISITTNATDFVKMTLTGHQHSDNAHADTLMRVEHGITLSSGFGAQDFLGGTAGDNASLESSTVNISCNHTDVQDGTGDHLIGQNHTATAQASSTWIGVPTTGVGEGWDATDTGSTTESNTGHVRTSYAATKSLTLAPPA